MHTNLILGANWAHDEWPEYVEVTHEGGAGGRRYVPKRTCSMAYDSVCENYVCSCCGTRFAIPVYEIARPCGPGQNDFTIGYRNLKYCPNCGARIVKEGQ